MSFNTDTENLIIIAFNPGAGGKFLQSCLALDSDCLHPLEVYAKNKFQNDWTEEQSFKASMSLLRLSDKHQSHIEFDHGNVVYGFSSQDNFEKQKHKTNQFFIDLTNQTRFKFFLIAHYNEYRKNISHFTNAKHVMMVNDKKILDIRTKGAEKFYTGYEEGLLQSDNPFMFDASSFWEGQKFSAEIIRLCKWLDLKIHNMDYIETMRAQFIKNLTIPIPLFRKNEKWSDKGYYKGKTDETS